MTRRKVSHAPGGETSAGASESGTSQKTGEAEIARAARIQWCREVGRCATGDRAGVWLWQLEEAERARGRGGGGSGGGTAGALACDTGGSGSIGAASGRDDGARLGGE